MNVVVLKSKLDALANAIGIKAGKRVPQTIDELVETVEGIQTGIEPTGTIAITSNGEHDVAGYATADVSVPSQGGALVITLSWDSEFGEDGGWVPDCTYAEVEAAYAAGREIACNLDGSDPDHYPISASITPEGYEGELYDLVVNVYWVDFSGGYDPLYDSYIWESVDDEPAYYLDLRVPFIFPNFESPTRTYTPSAQQQTDTITYDSTQGYNGIQEVSVTVEAVSLQAKTRTISASGTFTDTPDSGYDGLSSVQTTVPAVNPVVDQYGTFKTVSGQRKWDSFAYADADGAAGWFVDDGNHTNTKTYNAIAANTSVTPTESSQTIGGSNYMMEGAVTVNAISSSYVGSGITRRDSTDLSASGATVSVPAGYYASSASKAVASGSVTASATKSISSHTATVTPSASVTAGYISSGATGSAVTVQASELVSGNLAITENGSGIDCSTYSTVSVNVSGGTPDLHVDTKDVTLSSAASSISFTSLAGEPTSFSVVSRGDLATGAAPYKVAAVVFDGSSTIGQYITNTSNAQMTYDGSAFSHSYSNGTLTVTCSGASFQAAEYILCYTYGGGTIASEQVQVGSGATSITFTGISDEPEAWTCIFTSDIGTSSGYTRAHVVAYDGSSIYGMEMGSGSQATAHWTASFSNGSLTISSQSTTQGGYFHQPGYYELVYAIGGGNYQSKTVTPTTSAQTVTADSGYDALKRVTVEAIPSEYIIPTGNIAITSNTGTGQTLNVSQYATATVNVPTGGGGASVDTKTVTASNRPSTISFTSMKGEPIMFALKATFTMTSSSSTYYYVDSMRGYLSNNAYTVQGRLFRMGSTRQTENVQTGYSATYSGGTLTLTSTGNRTTSPGCFYNGSYELVYAY